MSQIEYLEILSLHSSNATNSFSIYISFTFAYLTVGYFVGAKLSLQHVFILTCLYVISAGVMALSVISHCQIIEAVEANNPTYSYYSFDGMNWAAAMSIVLSLGIIVSLYFMYSVRKKR